MYVLVLIKHPLDSCRTDTWRNVRRVGSASNTRHELQVSSARGLQISLTPF